MRAVGLMRHGGPEVLEVVELPEVQAGPGQIRIRNHAAAVNPTDTLARNGSRADAQKVDPPPYVPGMDAAGVVDQVGPGAVTSLREGDSVMAMVVPKGAHGAYREQIVLEAGAVVAAPANTTHAQACTLPMNGLTALQSLDLLNLSPGQVLAVTGGAGAYGGYVIALAKAAGLTVIADATPADRELIQSLGADIIVERSDSFSERVREHFPDGVDGLADGALLNADALSAIRDNGVMTSVRGYENNGERGIEVRPTWVRRYDGETAKLEQLRRLCDDGTLALRVADTYRPEDASETHRRLEAGGTRGRLVIQF